MQRSCVRRFVACVLLALPGAAAPSEGEVAALRDALRAGADAAGAKAAIEACVAAASAEAVPLLIEALDRHGAKLVVAEVEELRTLRALAAAPAAAPDGAGAAAGTQPARVVDEIARGAQALLRALAAAPRAPAVPLLLGSYEQSTRRVDELEREDEKGKGELAQLSSRLFAAQQGKAPEETGGGEGKAERLATEKAEQQAKVARTELLFELHRELRQALLETTGAVLRGAKGGEVDAAVKQLERRVDGKAAPAERALWVDLYARLGREEVPGELLGVAVEMARAHKRGEGELAKLRETYDKVKEQYFRATEVSTDGRISKAVADSFEAAQKAVAQASAAALALERLRDACSRAVGASVAALPEGAKRDRGITALVAAARGERDLESRVGVVEGCGQCDAPAVREALRKLVVEDKEVKARLAALEALVVLRDPAAVELARSRLLAHENWRVRVAAVDALSRLPDKESIPALIGALEVEQGRVAEDIVAVLQRLTGQAFVMSAPVWKQWWAGAAASFVLDPAKLGPARRRVAAWELEAEGAGKVTFYGIASASQRVCFVLDVSLSMQEPMQKGSERKKIDVAKEQLKQAIAALGDGDQFAIVVFAGSARRWSSKMTPVSAASRQKVAEWIDAKLELDQGTNIHAGLKEAFTIAGMGARDAAYDSAIDTLFFLSDGDATVGEVQDPLEIRRLVREWNRLSRIRIHAIGVGEAPNVALLYGLAEDSGGQFQKR